MISRVSPNGPSLQSFLIDSESVRRSGNTEAERFDNAVRKMFSVSKEELLKREAKWKRAQAHKKRAKKI
jgi:hypothetical protein